MTATTPAIRAISGAATCPHWCDGHPEGSSLHSRDLPGTWGFADDGPVLGLALEQEDGELGLGAARINIQVSRDGLMIDDAQSLGLAVAEDYAFSILRLVAAGRSAA